MSTEKPKILALDMTTYQWTVLLAAWLGWGFDVFDGLLFNYVAPNCVPTLLGMKIGSAAAMASTKYWNGVLTSLLLIGWGVGGIVFGRIADRLGRTRTLLITMLMYAGGTALCSIAQSIPMLVVFRILASLGIGGEWAAGASMVAEVVPEHRRVEAGALLYTSAPMGLFLATYLTHQIQGVQYAAHPEVAWRYVFLCGLIPAAVAFIVRIFVKEPERWMETKAIPAKLSEIFSPQLRKTTFSGLAMALVALITWWSCNAFIGVFTTSLAHDAASVELSKQAITRMAEDWKMFATNLFNIGGLIGTILTVPIAKHLGRKTMFAIYFALAAATLIIGFQLPVQEPHDRLWIYLPIGLSVFGIFGSFTFYLPELFSTRLRATGSGFCYNGGRFIATAGPWIVGEVSSRGVSVATVLAWLGVVPLLGLGILPFTVETRGQVLQD